MFNTAHCVSILPQAQQTNVSNGVPWMSGSMVWTLFDCAYSAPCLASPCVAHTHRRRRPHRVIYIRVIGSHGARHGQAELSCTTHGSPRAARGAAQLSRAVRYETKCRLSTCHRLYSRRRHRTQQISVITVESAPQGDLPSATRAAKRRSESSSPPSSAMPGSQTTASRRLEAGRT